MKLTKLTALYDYITKKVTSKPRSLPSNYDPQTPLNNLMFSGFVADPNLVITPKSTSVIPSPR